MAGNTPTQSTHLRPTQSRHVHQRFAHPKPRKESDCPHCYGKGYRIVFTIGLVSVCECALCKKQFMKGGV